MKKFLLQTCVAASLAFAAPAHAAVLSFELSGFADAFAQPDDGLLATVNGQFSYDTDTMLVSNVSIFGFLETYMSGVVMRGTGFGFADAFCVFTGNDSSFFFDLAGFDLDNTGLANGDTVKFEDVFAFESNDFTPDFQINNGFFLVGSVGALQTDAPSPIPVPASLPLLLAGLGGLVCLARRKAAQA